MTIQNDARRSHSPLTRCKTTEHHVKRCKHNPTLMQQRCCNGPAAFVPRSRSGDRLRHNPHDWRRMRDFPLSALRLSREKDAQAPCAATWHRRRTRAHKQAHLPWDEARGWGAPQLDGLCRKWFGILPLQCQKVTLRPVPDSASTPSRCAQRGGAPRHRRASGGVAQRLPCNGGQNQAVKKSLKREGGENQFPSLHELS